MYAAFYLEDNEIKPLCVFEHSTSFCSIPEWRQQALSDNQQVNLTELNEILEEEGYLYYECHWSETIPPKKESLSYSEWCEGKGLDANQSINNIFGDYWVEWMNDIPEDYNSNDYIEHEHHHDRILFILNTSKSFSSSHNYHNTFTKVKRSINLQLLDEGNS